MLLKWTAVPHNNPDQFEMLRLHASRFSMNRDAGAAWGLRRHAYRVNHSSENCFA